MVTEPDLRKEPGNRTPPIGRLTTDHAVAMRKRGVARSGLSEMASRCLSQGHWSFPNVSRPNRGHANVAGYNGLAARPDGLRRGDDGLALADQVDCFLA